ncbi:hypothetical protein U1Q18_013887 [Sarracenia purpurea var. burkii]
MISNVTEFNLSGLKVIVRLKGGNDNRELELKGRIDFFLSGRERELVDRTGSSIMPQILFKEKFFGGLVALNSLRNNGLFEQRLKEMLGGNALITPMPSLESSNI